MAIPDSVVQTVKSLIESSDGDKIVKCVHSALKELENSGHFYKVTVHCRHVGCHPENRDGSGVNAIDVHGLLDDLIAAGFVLDRVQAIGVEVSDEKELQWNQAMVDGTAGQLGTMDSTQLKVLSLSGSHTNFVMRLMDQQAEHESEIVSTNGRLSKELLARHDQAFHKAVTEGYQWRVLSKYVSIQLPELLALVQRMGNATLNRGEHELQLLRRLHGAWLNQSKQGPVEYLKVKKMCTQGVPPALVKSMPHLYSFALKAAGGKTPWLIQETEAFVRAHASSTKVLGADLWQALSTDVKGGTQLLRFRHAMVTGPIIF